MAKGNKHSNSVAANKRSQKRNKGLSHLPTLKNKFASRDIINGPLQCKVTLHRVDSGPGTSANERFVWLELRQGSLIPVEKNGKFQIARVLKIEGDLAHVQFENDQEVTTISRGSKMHGPIQDPVTRFKRIDLKTLPEYQGFIEEVKVPLHTAQRSPRKSKPDCVPPYVRLHKLKTVSPLAIPLFFGWSRKVEKVDRSLRVIYRTPCGRRIRNFMGINAFLKKSEYKFPVDFFSFDAEVNVLRRFVPRRFYYKNDDLSRGLEKRPVQVVNSIDTDPLPRFKYITESVFNPKLKFTQSETQFEKHCRCQNNCKGALHCACTKLNTSNKGECSHYRHRRLDHYNSKGLLECSSRCACDMSCPTRVVQCGITFPLQIFNSSTKNWGVRAIYDIPKGSFVCSFAGEILSHEVSEEVAGMYGSNYMVRLNTTDDSFTVDADSKGNIARFLNHSCTPNAFMQRVFIETRGTKIPTLAFFTSCLVKAGSEITIQYGYIVGSEPGVEVECHCGSPNCNGRLL